MKLVLKPLSHVIVAKVGTTITEMHAIENTVDALNKERELSASGKFTTVQHISAEYLSELLNNQCKF